ncbi:MAG: thioesterase family protein [Ilumatobacteraceae bacterium]
MSAIASQTPTFEFDRAIGLTTADSVSFEGAIEDGWDINGNANGGYLLAIAGAAMQQASGRPDPLTITAHYLAPGKAGPITVTTDVVKVGRQLVTMTGSLRSPDRELLRVIGSFGDITTFGGGFSHVAGAPPDLPPQDECVLRDKNTGIVTVNLMNKLRVWIRPEDALFQQGQKSGKATIEGWMEFADGRPIDSIALLLVVDAFPPPVFNIDIPPGWVPTVELTVHVRAVAAPGPLMCRFHTDFVQNGFLQEDSEIWDSTGTLVAQSRQLALLARV